MPVDSKHPEYDASMEMLCDDAFKGEVDSYISQLKGQTKKEFREYKDRATYFNVVRRTTAALIGAIMRKPMSSNIDLDMVEVNGDKSYKEFVGTNILNVMLGGRSGILVDYDDILATPYMVSYKNSEIINWTYEDDKLTLVMLKEDAYEVDPQDKYNKVHVCKLRELALEDGQYIVRIHRKDQKINAWTLESEVVPTMKGVALDFIPFVFANISGTANPSEPTLYNLSQLNISHYRTTADIEHGSHFTALPQPWLSGGLKVSEDEDATPQVLGIGTYDVWQLEEGSSVGYLEFSGAGMGQLDKNLLHKEEQMSAIGSRLLQDKKGVESVEALRIRNGAESATLVGVVDAIENALRVALQWYSDWSGSTVVVEFDMNRDFSPAKMAPQELTALLSSLNSGAISQSTFLENLYKGEIVDDVEEEMSNLNSENSGSVTDSQ